MSKNIDYGTLMHKAMRTLIFDVLKDVEKNAIVSGIPAKKIGSRKL